MEVGVLYNPNLWVKCRERVRCNSRPGAGNGGQQSGLAGVGVPHEAHVRNDSQLQQEIPLLACFARLRETRGLARGGGEIAIAQAAPAALAQDKPLAVFREILHQLAMWLWRGALPCLVRVSRSEER